MIRLNNLLIMLALFAASLYAQTTPPLTVIVVIDQFPMFLVDRYTDLYCDGGLKRLEREGVLFTECRYSHAVSETGPGHVTISSGCNPKTHGIVGNSWQKKDGGDVYCLECDGTHAVTDSGVIDSLKASCPNNIQTEVFADLWRASFGEDAKIWSMSLKDRAAVALAGSKPNGALWLQFETGKFQSSSYYTNKLPNWCTEYNATAGIYFDSTWERSATPAAYSRCDSDNVWYEDGTKAGLPNTMPKSLRGGETTPGKGYVRALQTTPFGNEWLYGLVKKCLTNEQLGKDGAPDLLCVSFSSNDMCGHTFGPYSQEILDMTLRTDKLIAEFLTVLDQQVGKGNYRFALTTDHGICPPCESPLLPSGVGGRFNFRKMKDELQDYLAQRFLEGVLPKSGLVSAFEVPTVYLNQVAIANAGLSLHDVAEATAEWLSTQPGVEKAVVTITAEDVAHIEDSNLRAHIEQSFHAERFSQVYLHPQPYWQSDGICANHGSIYEYDTHVPLYLMGDGFTGGRNSEIADPMDLVTQLATASKLRWTTPRGGKVHTSK
ncbi:MAG: alkaline phosphatase family protein [bacterium]|nr:alkaline phosphatase family protein [bacterium]